MGHCRFSAQKRARENAKNAYSIPLSLNCFQTSHRLRVQFFEITKIQGVSKDMRFFDSQRQAENAFPWQLSLRNFYFPTFLLRVRGQFSGLFELIQLRDSLKISEDGHLFGLL